MVAAIKSRREKTETISLTAEGFDQWARQHETELDFLKGNTSSVSKQFTVDNHGLDKALLINNSGYTKELNNQWLQNIAEDIYIQEAFFVLCDLVKIQQLK